MGLWFKRTVLSGIEGLGSHQLGSISENVGGGNSPNPGRESSACAGIGFSSPLDFI